MLVGYIWKLGYNPHTAWTYEMVLLFNTEKSLAYTVSEIQEFCEIFGARRGIDSYIIVPPAKRTGHREEKVAMFNSLDIKDKARSHKIQSLITDLIRTDYLVQVVAPDNGRTFGKGGITKKKSRVKTKR